MQDWHQAAQEYLAEEKGRLARQIPRGVAAFLEWRERTYACSVQEIAPEYSREIVLLSKSSQPISGELQGAILALEPGRPCLRAEAMLDLARGLHILRRSGNRMTEMTPEQTEYMKKKRMVITDDSTKQTATEYQPRHYANPEDAGSSKN